MTLDQGLGQTVLSDGTDRLRPMFQHVFASSITRTPKPKLNQVFGSSKSLEAQDFVQTDIVATLNPVLTGVFRHAYGYDQSASRVQTFSSSK